MRKTFSLALILILAFSSLIMIKPADSQTIPKPSVPEFTVKLVDNSYDVPPTTRSTTNYYKNITTTTVISGYHVRNVTIELTMRNQPYPPDVGGNKTSLIYQIQMKPHFAQNWTDASPTSIIPTTVPINGSGYTIANFPANYAPNDEVDFRVQSVLLYEHVVFRYTRLPFFGSDFGYYPFNVTDIYETSDWSPAQTFTMPNTPVQNPGFSLSLDAQITIFSAVAIVALLLAVASLLLYRKKQKTRKTSGEGVKG